MSVKRNKFLTSKEVYEERLAICRGCENYFKLTGNCLRCGCFMRIKAKIAPMTCPDRKWLKSGEIEMPEDIDKDLIKEVLDIFPLFVDKRAPDTETKQKFIELYNTIHGTSYDINTNCGSCVHTVWQGLNEINEKYKK